MKKLVFYLILTFLCLTGAYAQPRMIVTKTEKTPPALAQTTFETKYEGGMFGFSRKEEGTIKFDDANFRLVFFSKENKELFSIPYKAMIVIYPQSQSVQSTTGKVVQNMPLPGAGLAGIFIKEKRRYLIINFDDPALDAKGTVNFKFEDAKSLDSAIQTLGDKAEMQQRGDAFFRPKNTAQTTDK
jgi:hypothetical protein